MGSELEKLWKVNTALNVSVNKEALVYKGHGLGDTRWKGCAWKLLLFEILIKGFFVYNSSWKFNYNFVTIFLSLV